MLSPRKNSLALLCMLLACCQKVDLTTGPDTDGTGEASAQTVTIVGTGEGTMERPYTPSDIRSASLSGDEAVWVIGYLVGSARRTMSAAEFSIEASNESNILLSSDSLCTDTAHCIPVELSSDKWRKSLSLPTNTIHFRRCLLVKGIPSTYLNRKGLRSVSAGLWMDGFDITTVAPQEWEHASI